MSEIKRSLSVWAGGWIKFGVQTWEDHIVYDSQAKEIFVAGNVLSGMFSIL